MSHFVAVKQTRNMSRGSVLVTGANRGIGLGFVRHLVRSETPPSYVFATYRNKDTKHALEEIKESSNQCQLILIEMDVTKKEEVQSMRELVEECVGEKGLNLLINNAGVNRNACLADVTEEDMIFHLNTNTVGPISVLKEMLPLLKKAAASKESVLDISRTTVLNISSVVASVGNLDKLPHYILDSMIAYGTSKAALNMAMRNIALILKDQDILVVNMYPGWVRTDMGTDKGDIDVTESVSSMLNTLLTLDESRQGDFLDRHGKAIAF